MDDFFDMQRILSLRKRLTLLSTGYLITTQSI